MHMLFIIMECENQYIAMNVDLLFLAIDEDWVYAGN